MFMAEKVVVLLMQSVKEIIRDGLPKHKYSQISLSTSMARAKLSAMLGGSLIWITGGLNLVISLIKETLPCWFLSGNKFEPNGERSHAIVSTLRGCALAYLVIVSGALAWGVETSSSVTTKWRQHVIGQHLEFIASALERRIMVGCDRTIWRAYVTSLVSLLVDCTPFLVVEADLEILKRLSKGLIRLNEEKLALSLLSIAGDRAMGAAVELIVQSEF